jgi:hypothetical protein
MNADRSAGLNTRLVKARTLAMYHVANPNLQEGGRLKSIDSDSLVSRQAGQIAYTTVRFGAPNVVTNGCDCEPSVSQSTDICIATSITIVSVNYFAPNVPSDYTGPNSNYGYGNLITWDPIPNGYSVFSITQPGVTGTAFELLTATTANYFTDTLDSDPIISFPRNGIPQIVLTARLTGCPDISATFYGAPCFLAGALVTMADGSEKPIEDIRVGDLVLGAFGEHNLVLALHRPFLGNNTMTNINNEHHTSSHHPHISSDKKFYAVKPAVVMADTYGKSHEVLDENMVPYQRFLAGLNPGRVQLLELGVDLKTVDGSRIVSFLDTYEMTPDTQLYNLVLGGSHTYHVDGYAVTGWPKEDDFDYDAWVPR